MNQSFPEAEHRKHKRRIVPKTPQPKHVMPTDQELVNMTLSDIAETNSRIKDISQKNSEAHAQCVKLQHELSSITKALDKNIDFLQEVCRIQEEENEQLKQKLQNKTEIAEKIQMLLDKCAYSGVDVNKIPGLDVKTLSDYFIIRPPVDEGIQLDPTIKTIVDSNSLFTGITTNDQFVSKCIELKNEAMRPFPKSYLESGEVSEKVLTLRKQLAELQQNNSATQARMAREMSDLLNEKQKLQKQLEQLKNHKTSTLLSPKPAKPKNSAKYQIQNDFSDIRSPKSKVHSSRRSTSYV